MESMMTSSLSIDISKHNIKTTHKKGHGHISVKQQETESAIVCTFPEYIKPQTYIQASHIMSFYTEHAHVVITIKPLNDYKSILTLTETYQDHNAITQLIIPAYISSFQDICLFMPCINITKNVFTLYIPRSIIEYHTIRDTKKEDHLPSV
jgi:hypothetical protein